MLEKFERLDFSKYKMQSTPPAIPAILERREQEKIAKIAGIADPPCSDSDFSDPTYWHALAASGLGDMQVIPLTEALFLFALRKVESIPADDLTAMWNQYARRWEERLPGEAFKLIEAACGNRKGRSI